MTREGADMRLPGPVLIRHSALAFCVGLVGAIPREASGTAAVTPVGGVPIPESGTGSRKVRWVPIAGSGAGLPIFGVDGHCRSVREA
jgi:hypothetical protein